MLIAVRRTDSDLDEMCDLKTLKQWARSGQLQPHHYVRESGAWVEARHATMLKGIFTATAWDVPEDVLWTPQPKPTLSNKPKTAQGQSTVATETPSLDVGDSNAVNEPSKTGTTSFQLKQNHLNQNQRNQTRPSKPSIAQKKPNQQDTSPVLGGKLGSTPSMSDFDAEVRREYERSKPNFSEQKSNLTPSLETETAQSITRSLSKERSSISDMAKSGMGKPVLQTTTSTATTGEAKTGNSRTSKGASSKWNPELDIKDQLGLLVDEVPAKSNFSYIRLMILVVPGAFMLFMIRSFVVSEAQTVFPDATGPAAQQTQSAETESVQNAPVPVNTQSDSLYTLETKLKSTLRSNAQQVTPEQSLSDALRVDLEYVGLEIARIDARVLKWKGRLLDQPRVATIEVVVESGGEMEKEFILAALVVAKYSVRYYLEMPKFTLGVRDGDRILKKVISTEKAQYLYLQPGSLKEFIQHLSEAPSNPE